MTWAGPTEVFEMSDGEYGVRLSDGREIPVTAPTSMAEVGDREAAGLTAKLDAEDAQMATRMFRADGGPMLGLPMPGPHRVQSSHLDRVIQRGHRKTTTTEAERAQNLDDFLRSLEGE